MNSDVLQLIKKGESEQMEFKGPRSTFDTLARVVCGLLNQQGGFLVWGMNKNEPASVADAENKAKKLMDHLMTRINPRPFLSASVQEAKGESIVVVRVPPGSDKPYSFNRQIWVRIGTMTMRAGEDRSAHIVEEGALALERWEREPMPGFEIDDCDRDELEKARKEISEAGRFGADMPERVEDMLERLYLYRSGRLTNAAAVLFAAQPRMWSPEIFVRIVTYANDKSGPIANDVIVEGPAVSTIYDTITIIQQRTGYSGQFHKDRLRREDKPAYALFALRESMVNAVAHRAYNMLGGSIRVEIYPDRLIISNPGHLPEGWKPSRLRGEHKSVPFNPDIARVLYYRELMDQLGVGTQRIITECKQLGAKPPAWSAKAGMVSVTLFKAPEPTGDVPLEGRQADALQALHNRREFKVSDYAAAVGVSDRQARRDIVDLEEKGVIERVGKGRATVYRRRQDRGE